MVLQYTAKMNAEKLRKALHAHCNATLAAALGSSLDGAAAAAAAAPAPALSAGYRTPPNLSTT